ncbi:MAG: RidA family protein [Bacteroidetes bacterium]|jgi:enamine deaminase RidA (YjgF/YER057c/UK114 family)|nr:RidA family protein [Bacteroidota bacterium]
MKKQFIDPNEGFSQAVMTEVNNSKTIYISGQVGEGNNLESQTIATFQNLEKQLTNCNANFKDVVKMTTYIVNFNPENDLPIYRKIRKDFLGDENYPASTLVGVTILGKREWLIEIEAIAIIG